jgi:phosphoglycolate phosphatase
MVIKAVLFDFDGTIANTQDAFLEIVNELADEFGYPKIDLTQLERLKNLSSLEVIKESAIPPLKIPFLLKRVKKELGKKISHLEPYQSISCALKTLKEQGYLIGIVTSNLKENVMAFLEKNELDQLFDCVYSGTTLFGKDKIINRAMKEYQLKVEEVIYVGDETRDISAAQQSKIRMVSVAWGFNSPTILALHKPDFLVHNPTELLKVVAELAKH